LPTLFRDEMIYGDASESDLSACMALYDFLA